jgi:hypothetical protein
MTKNTASALHGFLVKTQNGRESSINRALDGSTYPSSKLMLSSLCKKKLVVKKCNNLYLGLLMPTSE